MRTHSILGLSLALTLLAGCSKGLPEQTTTAAKSTAIHETGGPDIVTVAAAAGDFTTLVAALKAAELIETLRGDGPFTVFAPTDAAFAKLPAGTVETLLRPENKEKLVAILTYHVVAGELLATEVVKLTSADTVEGEAVRITADGAGVRINDANIIATDVMATNGVIHVIDSVLIPSS
ncbi:MAG: fasciclin domain-containing protein [Polyangiales bacterium]